MPENSKPNWRHFNFVTAGPVDDYLHSLLPARDEVLTEMEEYASQHDVPIVGPAVGRILYQLALMNKAKTVFEMGSAIGYSTLWWAQAVGAAGRVYYTDGDSKNAERARGYFRRSGFEKRITVYTGDAIEYLSEQKELFDIIFCDIDKQDYPRAFRVAAPHLRSGGLFVADNVLWSGRVADPDVTDAKTTAILELNRTLYSSPDFFTTILPIRDGVAVAMKK
jgi:caffeoyl-CoA O-methyltransferase